MILILSRRCLESEERELRRVSRGDRKVFLAREAASQKVNV